MSLVLIVTVSIVFSLLLLWGLTIYSKRGAPSADTDLRELLLAREAGRIDEAEFQSRQAALHAALLKPPAAGTPRRRRLLSVGLALAALAGAGYWAYGHWAAAPGAAGGGAPAPMGEGRSSQGNRGGDLNVALKQLAEKLEKDPGNGEGWQLLGKAYGELRRFPEAAAAYGKAAGLLPPDAGLLADWVDTSVMANGGQWDDTARKGVKRALEIDPRHIKALALAGSEAFDRGRMSEAIGYWRRLQAAAEPGSMYAKLAEENISEAESRQAGKPAAAAAKANISGIVTVPLNLTGRLAADDTVFVFAQVPGKKGAPVAARRYRAAELPISFTLDDSALIAPGRSLATYKELAIGAKVSKSGDAAAGNDGLVAAPVVARPGSDNLVLELGGGR